MSREQPGKATKRAGRTMPAFTKPTPKTLGVFGRAVDGLPGIEHRTMFGYPSVFLNGNMLASIFQDRIMVRLSGSDRAEAIASGAKPFEPTPGRGMKEYVEFPPALIEESGALRRWVERGRAYVAMLPTKTRKKPK